MKPENYFHSRSSRKWDQPGSVTPPPSKPGSVPFLWEEKPGKPKKSSNSLDDNTGLLSPREVHVHRVDSDSHMTILEGLDIMNPNCTLLPCHSFSGRYEKEKKGRKREIIKAWFWRKKKDVENEVTRFRRNKSLSSISSLHGRSHLWANIRENLKHVIPWSSGGS